MKKQKLKRSLALVFIIGLAYLLFRASFLISEDDNEYNRWVWKNMCRDQLQKHTDEARISFLKFGLQPTLQRNGPFLTDCYQNQSKLIFNGEHFIVMSFGRDGIEGSEDDVQVVSKNVRRSSRLPFEDAENLN